MEANEVKNIISAYDHPKIKIVDINGKKLTGEFNPSDFTGASYNKKTDTLTFYTNIKKESKKPGRKPGKKIKPDMVIFYRRVTKEEYKTLDTFLKNMRNKNEKNKKQK